MLVAHMHPGSPLPLILSRLIGFLVGLFLGSYVLGFRVKGFRV